MALAVGAIAGLSASSTFGQSDAEAKADRAGIEFFEKHIRPVLATKCYECHSAEAGAVEGGLQLDTRAAIRRGGDRAAAVVPGNPDKSLLLAAIRYTNPDLQMPPDEPLPEQVVAAFEKWIVAGAPDPRDGEPASYSAIDLEAGRQHWAFQPIANPPVPAVRDASWPRTDIDRFVLAALEAQGLRPMADASPEALRRRIAFDLTGLPPAVTRSENSAFDAATWIDELLASPHFGERWARHWLDVARYADSTGSALNVPMPMAFRYRDWVIDAFNADKPYDQFVREQLAGDLLPAEDNAQRNAQLIATGFLVVGIKSLGENSQHRFRMAMADEQIDAAGRAFLALTVACAKCHDHKFDPIPTADYYALAGIFTSSEPMIGARRNRNRDPFATGLIPLAGSDADFSDDDQRELLRLEVDTTYKSLALRNERYRILREMGLKQDPQTVARNEAMLAEIPSVQALQQELDDVRATYEALRERYNAALPDRVMGMRDIEPSDCAIHIRGEDEQLGEVVPRGFLQVLVDENTAPVDRQQSGRLQLADWIASPHHPLTARVMVNRIWLHLFGMGLVETPDDFGHTGQPPSNPELLDYLAQRFIAHGWSVKSLVREIMTSRVYQLGTSHDAAAFEIDPANRLHWRMNRRRLDSDALLDAMRAISGELAHGRPEPVVVKMQKDDRLKSIDRNAWLAPSLKFRTIYQPLLREYVPEAWSLFDFPVPELVTGQRATTTVPTQALFLMNSPFIVEQSDRTAQRLLAQASDADQLAAAAYLLILNRPADTDELADAARFLRQFGSDDASFERALSALCQTLFASAEFRYRY